MFENYPIIDASLRKVRRPIAYLYHRLRQDEADLKYKAEVGLERLDKRLPLCLTVANKLYVPLLENWLTRMQQLEVHNLVVAAADSFTFDFLKSRGVSAVLFPCAGERKIHRLKTRLSQYFLNLDYDIILSDIDAVWIKDCIPFLCSENRDYEILVSIEYGYPPEIERAWGFSLCSGFYFIRSNLATKVFMNHWVSSQRLSLNSHDQKALNHLVYSLDAEWNFESKVPLTETGYGYYPHQVYSRQIISANLEIEDRKILIGALPLLKFHRGVSRQSETPYMVHIGSGSNVEKKISRMKENQPSAWFLNDVPAGS